MTNRITLHAHAQGLLRTSIESINEGETPNVQALLTQEVNRWTHQNLGISLGGQADITCQASLFNNLSLDPGIESLADALQLKALTQTCVESGVPISSISCSRQSYESHQDILKSALRDSAQSLRFLSLHDCELRKFPQGTFPRLTHLDISDNFISPESPFSGLNSNGSSFPSLQYLEMQATFWVAPGSGTGGNPSANLNNLSTYFPSILFLNLSHHGRLLRDRINLSRLTCLQEFYAAHNQLTGATFPLSLKCAQLDRNRLTHADDLSGGIPEKITLFVRENPLIPQEVHHLTERFQTTFWRGAADLQVPNPFEFRLRTSAPFFDEGEDAEFDSEGSDSDSTSMGSAFELS